MARGRSNRSNSAVGSRVSHNAPAHRSLSPLEGLTTRLPSRVSTLLSDVEDLRLYHPDPERGAVTFGGRYASVTVHNRPVVARSQRLQRWGFNRGLPVGLQVPVGVQFAHAFNVLTCVRRKVRREVLHARKKTGRGVKRRQPRRTWRSAIWC